MAIGVINNESTVSLQEEVTEGTYVAPSAATDYMEILSDGLEASKELEEVARDTLSSTIETEASRVGVATVNMSLPVELRSSATQGAQPQMHDLPLKSLLGGARTATGGASDNEIHTSTVIQYTSQPFAVGDTVLIEESGAFELRPISSVATDEFTLAFALENGAPANSVGIGDVATYYPDYSAVKSLSAEHCIGGEIRQALAGLRASSAELGNWSAGQIPTMTYNFQGLSLTRTDNGASYTPSFAADAEPPMALEACLWIDGSKKSYVELSMSIETTLTPLVDACSSTGKVAHRNTAMTVSLEVSPYMDDADLTEWTAFEQNTDVSVFFYAYNPSATAGEFSNAIAFWMPQCRIIAAPAGDQDGVATNALSLKAHQSSGNDSIFISFI